MIETRQLRSLAAAGLFLAFFIGFGRGVRRGHAGKIMAADAESESERARQATETGAPVR
jgi:hypothetical protein